MAKKCGHNVPCGCGDKALTTPPPCNVSGPCAGETCAELFSDECIVHTGEDLMISIGGTDTVVFQKGERISASLQKILVALGGVSQALVEGAYNIQVTEITSDGFKVTFNGDPLLGYTINAELQSPLTANAQVLGLGIQTYTYTGLTAGTYKIKIESTIAGLETAITLITLPV